MNIWSEDELWNQIREAEHVRRDYMHKYESAVESYTGPAFRQDKSSSGEVLSNVYEAVGNALPRFAFHRPKVRVSSNVAAFHARLSQPLTRQEAMEAALNQWAKANKIEKVTRCSAVDFKIFQAHVMVTRERYKGFVPEGIREMVGDVYHPKLYLLDPHDVFFDPLALNADQRRFTGHGEWKDIGAIISDAERSENAGWDMKVLREMRKEVDGKSRSSYATNRHVRRNDAYIRQVWVPEATLSGDFGPHNGYHGAVYTLISRDAESVPRLARRPAPYYGPPSGPYNIWGAYPVSGTSYSLSSVMATRQISEKTEFVGKQLIEQAENYRRILSAKANNGRLVKQLKRARNNQVIEVNAEDLSKEVKELVLGGVDRQTIEAFNIVSQLRDRLTGIDSQQRGAADPNATATASMIANNSAEAIGSYEEQVFQEGWEDVLEKVAWYFHYDREAAIQLGAKASEKAGLSDEDDFWAIPDPGGLPVEAMSVEIEPVSMSRGGDVQRRGAISEAVGGLLTLADASVKFPKMADWEYMAKALVESLNLGKLASSVNFNDGAASMSPEEQQMALTGDAGLDRAPGQNGSVPGTGGRFLRASGSAVQ